MPLVQSKLHAPLRVYFAVQSVQQSIDSASCSLPSLTDTAGLYINGTYKTALPVAASAVNVVLGLMTGKEPPDLCSALSPSSLLTGTYIHRSMLLVHITLA